jgi:hypothetical protein
MTSRKEGVVDLIADERLQQMEQWQKDGVEAPIRVHQPLPNIGAK